MKIFYFFPLILTIIFAGMYEYGGGAFSAIRDYSISNLDNETSRVIIKSEWRIVGRWGSAAYDMTML